MYVPSGSFHTSWTPKGRPASRWCLTKADRKSTRLNSATPFRSLVQLLIPCFSAGEKHVCSIRLIPHFMDPERKTGVALVFDKGRNHFLPLVQVLRGSGVAGFLIVVPVTGAEVGILQRRRSVIV